jgi:hypothetical protein
MLYFKSCPRCLTGTVEHSNDLYSEYIQCLMCGFMHDVPDGSNVIAELRRLHVAARAAKAAAEAEEKAKAVA